MSIETDIRARLLADAGVSAIVGTRIYAVILPQDPTYPAASYQRISGPRMQELAGATDRAMARIQIDSWAVTYAGAQSLAAAIRESLNGFIGTLTTHHAVIRLDNERDWYESEAGVYRVIQDYTCNHTD